jgi:hypothetical protein
MQLNEVNDMYLQKHVVVLVVVEHIHAALVEQVEQFRGAQCRQQSDNKERERSIHTYIQNMQQAAYI